MAKTQTFTDKLKKNKGAKDLIHVKVIQGYKSESGSVKYWERFVKVSDQSEIAKIDLRN